MSLPGTRTAWQRPGGREELSLGGTGNWFEGLVQGTEKRQRGDRWGRAQLALQNSLGHLMIGKGAAWRERNYVILVEMI